MTPTDTAYAQDLTHETLDAYPDYDNHERVVDCHDPATGLHAIIAIHNTKRGPALGGSRMWGYAKVEEGITDALRLSRGMSYKHAIAGTPYGGGKAVILADSRKVHGAEREALFEAFGSFVDQLNGTYITAEDVGTSPLDMINVSKSTHHVVGLPRGLGGTGDPSPMTAYGVYCGIQAALAFRAKRSYNAEGNLSGTTVAVQGLGHVGQYLCQFLQERGAKLIVADIHEEKVQKMVDDFGATAVGSNDIYAAGADVFAPCAMGAVINPDTLKSLKAKIIAGAANNQLSKANIGDELTRLGILYAPDYVINAGGVINISYEGPDYSVEVAREHTRRVGTALMGIFQRAAAENLSTARVADEIAEEKLNA